MMKVKSKFERKIDVIHKSKSKMRDLQSSISQMKCFEFESPASSTSKGRKETRACMSAYAPRSRSRNALQRRATSSVSDKTPTRSNHKCISIGDMTKPKDSQHILVGSALRRPHATGYSPMDYQTMPDVGKAPKQPYRPQTACTVYTYANRPISAAKVVSRHGKETKSSILRQKSTSCDSLNSVSSSKSLPQGTSANSKKRLCKVREDYRPFKTGHSYQPITSNGESIHSFLIGARYNNTRCIDSKTLSKLGVYIPKAGLKTFFVKENNWIKEPHDDATDHIHNVAVIDKGSRDFQSNSIDKALGNSAADTENKAINTEPHFLSIDRWHSAEWVTDRKPTSEKAPRAHTAPSRFKPINTFYYDYDSGKKYKYGM